MKKALIFAFAAVLLSVMCFHAIPARAAAEVTFNGEWRVRGYAYDIDARKDADNTQTFWDQRFRLYITAKANDNLKGVVRILTPDNTKWGTMSASDSSLASWNGAANPWTNDVTVDVAFLDFDIPQTKLHCSIGKQFLSLGNYIVLGSYATYDSLVLSTQVENVKLAVFTAKLNEDDTSDSLYAVYAVKDPNGVLIGYSAGSHASVFSEDDEDIYGLTVNFNLAPNVNIGLFGVMGNDGELGRCECNCYGSCMTDCSGMCYGSDCETYCAGDYVPACLINHASIMGLCEGLPKSGASIDCDDEEDASVVNYFQDADAYWLGATANIDYAPLKMKFEADYSRVDINYYGTDPNITDVKIKGYALFGDICADLDFAKIGVAGLYTSGAKYDDAFTVHAFVPISSRFSYWNKYDEMVLKTYLNDVVTNVTSFKLYAMKELTPKLTGTLSVQTYKFSEDPDGPYNATTGAGAIGTDLGIEVDAKACYKVYENLTLTAIGAYWFTDSDTFGQDSDDNWLLKHEIEYKF